MIFEVIPKRSALVNVDLQNCFVEGYDTFGAGGEVQFMRWPR